MIRKAPARPGGIDALARQLHDQALAGIEGLLRQLAEDATNPDVAEALAKARKLAEPVSDELASQIQALKRHARWDTFTIALYGETNAGKSSIIETMRSIFGEATKTEARRAFRALQDQHGLTANGLATLQDGIATAKAQCATLDALARAERERADAELAAADVALASLRQRARARRSALNFFQRMHDRFRTVQADVAVDASERQRCTQVASQARALERIDAQRAQAAEALRALEDRKTSAEAAFELLKPLADGLIVGDGRADFTVDMRRYAFEAGGRRFELLDVPGIEGKESQVKENIANAVKGAHAVFYVTRKAATPQTGDRCGQGTLEKIRMHLGDQTEVHAIYNKSITTPEAFPKCGLVDKEERASLEALDRTLREYLGERYRGHVALSVQPAFLATADCLVPGSAHDRKRAKFMAGTSVDELLARCGIVSFVEWLGGDMVSDSERRIRAANVHKVRTAVLHARDELSGMQRKELAPLVTKVRRNWSSTSLQIDKAIAKVSAALETTVDGCIREFETKLRNQMYTVIDGDIGNDELKHSLHANVHAFRQGLEASLVNETTAVLENFQKDLTEILDRLEKRIEQLSAAFNWRGSDGFGELTISFASGVDYFSLLTSLVGGIMLFWSPAGWVIIALGAVNAVVGIVKAVRSLLDKDYKKAHQRKAVNEHIHRIVAKMHEATLGSLEEVRTLIATKVEEISAQVQRSVDQAQRIDNAMTACCTQLADLASNMDDDGET